LNWEGTRRERAKWSSSERYDFFSVLIWGEDTDAIEKLLENKLVSSPRRLVFFFFYFFYLIELHGLGTFSFNVVLKGNDSKFFGSELNTVHLPEFYLHLVSKNWSFLFIRQESCLKLYNQVTQSLQ
jgi:hypothetical protein